MAERKLTDEDIRAALFEISEVSITALEGQMALSRLLVARLPGLPPDGRDALLKAVEKDAARIENLRKTVQALKEALGLSGSSS